MNTLEAIAYEIRNHYFVQLEEEYQKQTNLIIHLNNECKSDQNQYRLKTDFETDADSLKGIKFADIKNISSDQSNKLYRDDIVVMKGPKQVNSIMCWPTIICDEDEFDEEDIPSFVPFNGRIKQTEIELHPFPWFCCKITFFPHANAIQGILEIWFNNWFYRQIRPDPFLNVIHYMDGPHVEKEGGESYFIDFGTAPPEAFLELIEQVCRKGVNKILIN